ncbi:MAG: TetR/AcrR family transcriptional regulator [Rhodoplanes sp.]|uniref:TetR/AcrR family transcriptional regulator n=1 Tax=Rhodoplanes sp. TaxID=1968906 RepID=UPI001824AB95|nr:TetR/AcrR family transcriptional regulator [Rhodoplanes sp.]NVO15444.1 TetR/AcrR family transcriptional regulator [Rhodoplanes sp.]
MRRTKQEAEQTRESILAASENLFKEKGVVDVSIEEIAEAAGFTRGAVHWHFHDKKGLLLALADRRGLPLEQLAERLKINKEIDPLDELDAVVGRVFSDMERDSTAFQLETTLANVVAVQAPDRLRAFEHNLRRAITTIFEFAEQHHRLKPEWPASIAGFACYGLMSGLVNAWLRGDAGFTLTKDVMDALRAFITAVSVPKPAGS